MKKSCKFLCTTLALLAFFTSCGEKENRTAEYQEPESVPVAVTESVGETETESVAEKSMPPEIIACTSGKDAISGTRFYLLCGKVESAGTVTITGGNIDTISQYTGRTRFFIPVYGPMNKNLNIQITFTADGKTESDPLTYQIEKARDRIDFANFSIGKGNNFVHWPDWVNYACANYMSRSSLESTYNMLVKRNQRIKDACGDDTRFIIMLAPDPMVMYDESVNDEVAQMRRDGIEQYNARSGHEDIDPDAPIYTAMNEIADYVVEQDPDFTMIDMTPILKELKQEETYPRLYHTTDNHWSSLGAYYGYREIMNVIYEQTGNEGTKPLELTDFDIVDYELTFANMAGFTDPWSLGICEVVDLLVPKIERTAKLTSGEILNDGRFWSDVQHPMTFEKEGDLPTVVFLRDSFATSMYPMLNEHFSWAYYGETWNYGVDYDWLAEVDPDYVIIIAVERLAMSALQQR